MYLESVLFRYYGCCVNQEYYNRTAHILTHYIGGTLQTLRADLKAFVSANTKWIHDTYSDILQLRKQKVEDFCNSLIEPGFQFDELAITVVCKMKNIHCLVLLENSYWTTRVNFDFRGRLVKLCYLGGGIYKEIAPKYTGAPVKFGSKKRNFTVDDPPQCAVKDPLSSDFNVGRLSDHDEAQQPSNETDLAGIEDLVDTGLLPSVENHDGPTDVDISKETPPVENQNGPTAVDSSEPPVQNCDGPITTDAVPSVENHDGPTDVDISKETPPVENRDAHITTDAVSSLENHNGPSDVDISKETPPAVDSSEPPVQNRDGPRSIDEPLVQDNGSESDVSTRDKKDSNDSNPDKDGSENQTDAT